MAVLLLGNALLYEPNLVPLLLQRCLFRKTLGGLLLGFRSSALHLDSLCFEPLGLPLFGLTPLMLFSLGLLLCSFNSCGFSFFPCGIDSSRFLALSFFSCSFLTPSLFLS